MYSTVRNPFSPLFTLLALAGGCFSSLPLFNDNLHVKVYLAGSRPLSYYADLFFKMINRYLPSSMFQILSPPNRIC